MNILEQKTKRRLNKFIKRKLEELAPNQEEKKGLLSKFTSITKTRDPNKIHEAFNSFITNSQGVKWTQALSPDNIMAAIAKSDGENPYQVMKSVISNLSGGADAEQTSDSLIKDISNFLSNKQNISFDVSEAYAKFLSPEAFITKFREEATSIFNTEDLMLNLRRRDNKIILDITLFNRTEDFLAEEKKGLGAAYTKFKSMAASTIDLSKLYQSSSFKGDAEAFQEIVLGVAKQQCDASFNEGQYGLELTGEKNIKGNMTLKVIIYNRKQDDVRWNIFQKNLEKAVKEKLLGDSDSKMYAATIATSVDFEAIREKQKDKKLSSIMLPIKFTTKVKPNELSTTSQKLNDELDGNEDLKNKIKLRYKLEEIPSFTLKLDTVEKQPQLIIKSEDSSGFTTEQWQDIANLMAVNLNSAEFQVEELAERKIIHSNTEKIGTQLRAFDKLSGTNFEALATGKSKLEEALKQRSLGALGEVLYDLSLDPNVQIKSQIALGAEARKQEVAAATALEIMTRYKHPWKEGVDELLRHKDFRIDHENHNLNKIIDNLLTRDKQNEDSLNILYVILEKAYSQGVSLKKEQKLIISDKSINKFIESLNKFTDLELLQSSSNLRNIAFMLGRAAPLLLLNDRAYQGYKILDFIDGSAKKGDKLKDSVIFKFYDNNFYRSASRGFVLEHTNEEWDNKFINPIKSRIEAEFKRITDLNEEKRLEKEAKEANALKLYQAANVEKSLTETLQPLADKDLSVKLQDFKEEFTLGLVDSEMRAALMKSFITNVTEKLDKLTKYVSEENGTSIFDKARFINDKKQEFEEKIKHLNISVLSMFGHSLSGTGAWRGAHIAMVPTYISRDNAPKYLSWIAKLKNIIQANESEQQPEYQNTMERALGTLKPNSLIPAELLAIWNLNKEAALKSCQNRGEYFFETNRNVTDKLKTIEKNWFEFIKPSSKLNVAKPVWYAVPYYNFRPLITQTITRLDDEFLAKVILKHREIDLKNNFIEDISTDEAALSKAYKIRSNITDMEIKLREALMLITKQLSFKEIIESKDDDRFQYYGQAITPWEQRYDLLKIGVDVLKVDQVFNGSRELDVTHGALTNREEQSLKINTDPRENNYKEAWELKKSAADKSGKQDQIPAIYYDMGIVEPIYKSIINNFLESGEISIAAEGLAEQVQEQIENFKETRIAQVKKKMQDFIQESQKGDSWIIELLREDEALLDRFVKSIHAVLLERDISIQDLFDENYDQNIFNSIKNKSQSMLKTLQDKEPSVNYDEMTTEELLNSHKAKLVELLRGSIL